MTITMQLSIRSLTDGNKANVIMSRDIWRNWTEQKYERVPGSSCDNFWKVFSLTSFLSNFKHIRRSLKVKLNRTISIKCRKWNIFDKICSLRINFVNVLLNEIKNIYKFVDVANKNGVFCRVLQVCRCSDKNGGFCRVLQVCQCYDEMGDYKILWQSLEKFYCEFMYSLIAKTVTAFSWIRFGVY